MKYFILLAPLAICIFACSSDVDKNDVKNIALVKSYVAAVENLDYESMDNYLDPNYLGMGPSYGDTINKKEAVENWKWCVENLYEKIHYNRSRYTSVNIPDGDNKGEWVVTWAEMNIIYKNAGESVTLWSNSNYLVENGKIIRSLTFYNEADALRQLGYKFVPGDAVE